MEPLLPSFRRELRARAHYLHPVAAIGQHGLTPSVLHEIDVALIAHELIKVRIFSDNRAEREEMLVRVCDALDCAAVQQIGKLLVLWRPRPATEAAESAAKEPRKERRVGGQRMPSPTPTRRRRATGSEATPSPGRVRAPRSHGALPSKAPGSPPFERTPHGTSKSIKSKGMRKTHGKASSSEPLRVRAPGKAPTGVPRAAAPRRHRRAS
jgi:RNA-binding protein